MKVKDIAKKYGDYEIDENELNKLFVKLKQKSIFNLEIGDKYYSISHIGIINESIWGENPYNKGRLSIGNVFLTQEEAEFELERRKVEEQMLRLGGTRDMMSIGDEDVPKYILMYSCYNNSFSIIALWNTCPFGVIYFSSREQCQNAIDTIGEDRIKKYIFNVKD